MSSNQISAALWAVRLGKDFSFLHLIDALQLCCRPYSVFGIVVVYLLSVVCNGCIVTSRYGLLQNLLHK